MLLEISCKSCNSKTNKSYLVNDRIGMAQKFGEEINETCIDCGAEHDYHVDEFKAINNVKFRLILVGVAIVSSIILGFFGIFNLNPNNITFDIVVSLLFVTPFTLFIAYLKFDKSSIRAFNHLKFKGRNINIKAISTAGKAQINTVEQKKSVMSAFKSMNKDLLPSNRK